MELLSIESRVANGLRAREYDCAVRLLEREPLLDRLSAQLDRAHEHGLLVLVAGEAGIGKTALLEAFSRERVAGPTLWGACDSVVPARPFAPVADIASWTLAYDMPPSVSANCGPQRKSHEAAFDSRAKPSGSEINPRLNLRSVGLSNSAIARA
jgi:AAA ATPase domain